MLKNKIKYKGIARAGSHQEIQDGCAVILKYPFFWRWYHFTPVAKVVSPLNGIEINFCN
jgi:hypothetical protein